MLTKGLKANVITYSSVINACAQAGQYERAIELLLNAVEKGYFQEEILGNSELNLHCDGVYTQRALQEQIKAGRISNYHMIGIPSKLAFVIFRYRDQQRNFSSSIIVGRHGDDILKNVAIEFLTTHNYSYKMIQDEGIIIDIKKL